MAGIFISYRQDDAMASASSLCRDLVEAFGADQVFLDKEALHAGNWLEQIERALARCRVVLVVIGPRWLTIADDQERARIHLADDVHRQEIALALNRPDSIVIPVLVDEAPMPRPDQLPADLRRLHEQQVRKIGDTQARRKADLEVLIEDIESVGGIQPRARLNARDQPGPPRRRAWAEWLKLGVTTLASAFAITLAVGMAAYLSGHDLGGDALSFLLLVFAALVLGVRWLWRSFFGAKRERT